MEQGSETSSRGGFRGRGSHGGSGRGRGGSGGRSGSYFATMKYYNYWQLGHPAYSCPEKASSSNLEKRVAYAQEDTSSFKSLEVNRIESEMGENMMFRRVLTRQLVKEESK